MSRNNFVKAVIGVLGTIMGAVVGLPAVGYLISPALKKQESEAFIPMGPLEQYPVGVPTLFTFTRTKVNGWERTVNSYGVFVLRRSEAESDVKVLSNVCTHLSCRVNWDEAIQEYVCPCHDAFFDIEGEVVSGPPPRALDVIQSTVEDGILILDFKEG